MKEILGNIFAISSVTNALDYIIIIHYTLLLFIR